MSAAFLRVRGHQINYWNICTAAELSCLILNNSTFARNFYFHHSETICEFSKLDLNKFGCWWWKNGNLSAYKASSDSVLFWSRQQAVVLHMKYEFLHKIWGKAAFLTFSNILQSICVVGHVMRRESFFWGWSSYSKTRENNFIWNGS